MFIVSFELSSTAMHLSRCAASATLHNFRCFVRRDARRNWTAENHLYNLVHRGYTAEAGGHATCCFDFYKYVAGLG